MSSVQIITPVQFPISTSHLEGHDLLLDAARDLAALTTEAPIFRDASPEVYSPFRRSYRKKSTKLSVFSLDAPENEDALKPCDSTRADSLFDSFSDESDEEEEDQELANIFGANAEDDDEDDEEEEEDNMFLRTVNMIPSRQSDSNALVRDAYFQQAINTGKFE